MPTVFVLINFNPTITVFGYNKDAQIKIKKMPMG